LLSSELTDFSSDRLYCVRRRASRRQNGSRECDELSDGLATFESHNFDFPMLHIVAWMWNGVMGERAGDKSRHRADSGARKNDKVGRTIKEIPKANFYDAAHQGSNLKLFAARIMRTQKST
jgi:hypothetical protein